MNKALADFAQNPLEYDLSEMMDEGEIQEMARDVESLRKELYDAAGRNRDYHVKAEDVKSCLLYTSAPTILLGLRQVLWKHDGMDGVQ